MIQRKNPWFLVHRKYNWLRVSFAEKCGKKVNDEYNNTGVKIQSAIVERLSQL